MPNPPESHRQLLRLLHKQERALSRLYAQKAVELSRALRGYQLVDELNPWKGNAIIKRRVDAVLGSMSTQYKKMVKGYLEEAVLISDTGMDDMIRDYMKGLGLSSQEQAAAIFRQTGPISAFLTKRVNGLDTSTRVWNIKSGTRAAMQSLLVSGLMEGRPAASMATDLKRYLKYPNKRFRRIRDKKTGKLKLSNPAKNFHPGRGVYRSSFQNALRLARTETNIAFRHNDHLRVQELPFVKGVKVNLSPAHPQYDICDDMQGPYPPKFQFIGWHPNCLCYVTTVLMPRSEFKKHLGGQKVELGEIRRIPARADRYLRRNAISLNNAKSTPYFLKDNFNVNANGSFDLKPKIKAPRVFSNKSIPGAAPGPPAGPAPGLSPFDKALLANDFQTALKLNRTATPQAFREAHLAQGIVANDGAAAAATIEKMAKFDFIAIKKKLDAEMARITKTVVDSEGAIKAYLDGKGLPTFVEYRYVANKGLPDMVEVARTFDVTTNSVEHSLFFVGKNLQGKGLGKKVIGTYLEQYKKMGIKSIHVGANLDVGGYAWGQYGFKLSQWSHDDILELLKDAAHNPYAGPAPKKALKYFEEWTARNGRKGFPMGDITGMPGMKKYFINSNWEGYLDLDDAKALARFESYLSK